jgi:hypothetical protein
MGIREVWFERCWWSYMPCHWKGWALIAAFVVGTLVSCRGLDLALSVIGHPDWAFVADLPFIPALILLWLSAERHSAPRRH